MIDKIPKVLLIEDEESLRKPLADKFRSQGFEVTECADGEDGLARAFEIHPDLILLNLILPKKDGISVMRDLRADSWGKDVPIIILTVMDANEEILKEIIVNRPAHYFIKSDWKIDDVVQKVNELIRPS